MLPAGGMYVAAHQQTMRGDHPHRHPTTLDVLDHVLDKGIVVDTRGTTSNTQTDLSVAGLRLFGVNARVVIADFTGTDTSERA